MERLVKSVPETGLAAKCKVPQYTVTDATEYIVLKTVARADQEARPWADNVTQFVTEV